MSLWANAHDLAHQREIEQLQQELGTKRARLEQVMQENTQLRADLGHALADQTGNTYTCDQPTCTRCR